MIRVRCPHCKQIQSLPEELARQIVKCPACTQAMLLPKGAASVPLSLVPPGSAVPPEPTSEPTPDPPRNQDELEPVSDALPVFDPPPIPVLAPVLVSQSEEPPELKAPEAALPRWLDEEMDEARPRAAVAMDEEPRWWNYRGQEWNYRWRQVRSGIHSAFVGIFLLGLAPTLLVVLGLWTFLENQLAGRILTLTHLQDIMMQHMTLEIVGIMSLFGLVFLLIGQVLCCRVPEPFAANVAVTSSLLLGGGIVIAVAMGVLYFTAFPRSGPPGRILGVLLTPGFWLVLVANWFFLALLGHLARLVNQPHLTSWTFLYLAVSILWTTSLMLIPISQTLRSFDELPDLVKVGLLLFHTLMVLVLWVTLLLLLRDISLGIGKMLRPDRGHQVDSPELARWRSLRRGLLSMAMGLGVVLLWGLVLLFCALVLSPTDRVRFLSDSWFGQRFRGPLQILDYLLLFLLVGGLLAILGGVVACCQAPVNRGLRGLAITIFCLTTAWLGLQLLTWLVTPRFPDLGWRKVVSYLSLASFLLGHLVLAFLVGLTVLTCRVLRARSVPGFALLNWLFLMAHATGWVLLTLDETGEMGGGTRGVPSQVTLGMTLIGGILIAALIGQFLTTATRIGRHMEELETEPPTRELAWQE